jgi:membrane protein implicated in regulation of membrane protease activity
MMQERHPLDVLSLVFGLLFAALAIPVLVTDTPWEFEAAWVVPAVIVAIGLVIGASAFRRREPGTDLDESTDPAVAAAMGEFPEPPDFD